MFSEEIWGPHFVHLKSVKVKVFSFNGLKNLTFKDNRAREEVWLFFYRFSFNLQNFYYFNFALFNLKNPQADSILVLRLHEIISRRVPRLKEVEEVRFYFKLVLLKDVEFFVQTSDFLY